MLLVRVHDGGALRHETVQDRTRADAATALASLESASHVGKLVLSCA